MWHWQTYPIHLQLLDPQASAMTRSSLRVYQCRRRHLVAAGRSRTRVLSWTTAHLFHLLCHYPCLRRFPPALQSCSALVAMSVVGVQQLRSRRWRRVMLAREANL